MKQHARQLVIAAVILGWLLDFLFWKQAPGVNFALYAVLCLVAGFLLLRSDDKRIAGRAVWLIPLIVIFAAVTFVRMETLTTFLALLLTLFLMAVLAVTFLGGRWLEYTLPDYAVGFVRLVASMIARPLAFQSELERERKEAGKQPSRAVLWPVLRGILIALPVLLVFGALLASADLVFSRELDALAKLLRLERLPEYIFRLIYILAAAYALIGVFLHAATQSRDEQLIADGKPPISPFLGFVETAIVLGSVIALFLAFVVVQFRYFFGGQANINLEGFTYSEYARRGFGELLAVAVISLLLILVLGAVTRRETRLQQQLFSGMSVAIVALVGVMLVSAYQRLSLYEAAYGFSRLRTYVHVFLIWIGLLLAAVVVLELLHRERAFTVAALLASIGFALTLAVLNVDGFIARQNVNRAVTGAGLDVPYLVFLSSDSVPVLTGIYQSPSYPAATRDAVGAILACRDRLQPARRALDWRAFNLSRWRAAAALDAIRPQLAAYQTVGPERPLQVLTPGKVLYECFGGPD